MCIPLFLAMLKKNNDTQADLAKAMGISLSTLNNKIHGRDGAEFWRNEVEFCIKRYRLTEKEVIDIFFA